MLCYVISINANYTKKSWGCQVPSCDYNFLVEVMEKTNLAALHRRRITIVPKDMQLVKNITHMW